jgi:uncharacterized repeat protein (TIGR01451 family)
MCLLRLLFVALGIMSGLAAAHANNTFPGTTISGAGSNFSASNVGATGETGEPTTYGGGNLNTMWYSWTAPGNGTVTFETCGNPQTTFDTTLKSYTGTAVNALTVLAQNDDTTGCATTVNPNYGSRITWNVTQGSTYRIQVDGYGNATGTFRLTWRFTGFTVAKSVSSATISAPGTLTYTITVANAGVAALTGPTITDSLLLGAAARTLTSGPTLSSGDSNSNGQVDTTETWVYTATFAVPQADIDLGGTYANTATFDTAETIAHTSNTATTAITQSPALSIDKSWAFASPGDDADGDGLADVGDLITYTYAVTNTGNVTVTGVSVNDTHNGYGSLSAITPASVASLAPAATALFTATYTAIQADIDNP